ncbi:MAG TPA: HDOD domain-containing protein [Clostridia bacterium]|nr:HDOD domain-containing protein [Clostridia bacterium]
MASSIKQLTEGIPSLGSYAGVMVEIERVLNDSNSTLGNLGEVIEKDPDLASRLLRLGNSAFYGFARRLETVAEAISLIGIQQVRDLIVASSVIEVFEGVSPSHVSMESFWKHSLACGIGARCLAIARQMPAAEKFFVAGLLHDLGRLVLLARIPQKATDIFELYQSRKMLLRDAERGILGFDHAQIGEELLRGWQFPSNLTNAVAHHHQPMAAGIFQLESSVVHLADYLVHAMQMGNSGEHFVPPLNLKAWERVGLSADILESIMKSIDEQIEAVQDSFLRLSKSGSRQKQ